MLNRISSSMFIWYWYIYIYYVIILYYIILYHVVYIYWLMKIGDQNPWSNQYQGISILQMLYVAPWLSMTSGRLTVVPGSTARTRWTILVKRRSNHRKPTVIGCTRPGKHTKKLLNMAINSWFTHEKWWISMVMFVYQRAKPREKAYWATLFRPRMATIGPSKFASYFWQAWKVMNRICREARIPQSSHNSVRFVFMSMYYMEALVLAGYKECVIIRVSTEIHWQQTCEEYFPELVRNSLSTDVNMFVGGFNIFCWFFCSPILI